MIYDTDVLVKLYFSSLLVSLNSRAGLRKTLAHDRLMLPMGTVTQSSFSGLSHSNDEKRPSEMVNVVTRRSSVADRLERRDYSEFFVRSSHPPFYFSSLIVAMMIERHRSSQESLLRRHARHSSLRFPTTRFASDSQSFVFALYSQSILPSRILAHILDARWDAVVQA